MPKKRGGRGADLYAARQTADITPTTDEIEELGGEPDPADLAEPEDIEDEEPQELDPLDEPEDEEDEEPELTTMQRQLAALQTENATLKKRADDADVDTAISQHAVLNQALAGAKAREIAAEAAIAAASESGDHTAMARATKDLTKAVQDIDRFELAADEMTAEIEERKKPKLQTAAADPYVASIKAFSDPSKDWLIKNRRHIEGDAQAGRKAQGLALLAMSEGIAEDSPEFFDYLDKGMGFAVAPKRNKPAPGRPQTGAPSGNRAGNGKVTEVVLSAAQRNAARSMGMTLKEYAKSVQEIQNNGKDPNRSGLRFSAQTAHSSRR